ncbi:beta-lactamase family protein [Lentzea tibetensis]|uniref:Beta-lactamase family protein n=1 Tax=Lentzea tibetensis TaxID=2591470 RepID=A0A563ESS7_9PSEU|nr:serine hydrolase domain-containing protein [Lentzea tibetensis]TWP50194.1 beta-lactamase family protein [Lentzea tibetensis]
MIVALALTAALTAPTADHIVTEHVEATGLPGVAVAVTKGDEVILTKGYGVSEHTPMRIASLSKSFVATAVVQLVDRGEIDLDRPVHDQLPEFTTKDPRGEKITVRQLLNQTSGLADETTDVDRVEKSSSLREAVEALATAELKNEPGEKFRYHNPNYTIAARLVEHVSGIPFADYMRDNVFTPLGMTSTKIGGSTPDGHIHLYGVWVPRPELPGFDGDSVTSTAHDMARWLIAQRKPGIVSAEGLRTLHTAPPGGDYAMGWDTREPGRKRHGGNLFTHTAAQVFTDSGYGVVVMTNSAALQDESYPIVEALLAQAEGRAPTAPEPVLWLIDLVLGLLALGALALGTRGIRTARRDRARWRALPHLLPIAALPAYLPFVEFLTRRTVTWAQLLYLTPTVVILLAACALAGAATITARVVAWRG